MVETNETSCTRERSLHNDMWVLLVFDSIISCARTSPVCMGLMHGDWQSL